MLLTLVRRMQLVVAESEQSALCMVPGEFTKSRLGHRLKGAMN